MKFQNTTKLLVLAKVESQGIKDSTKTFYSLTVMQDTDAGSISCPKEVFDVAVEGQINTFLTEFNQNYNSFRITGIVKSSGEKPKAN